MEPPKSAPTAASTKLPVVPAAPVPITLANWKAPPPPPVTPMKVSKPNVAITITAKDPFPLDKNTETLKTEPLVRIECPASLYDWSALLKDLIGDPDSPGIEQWDSTHPFEYEVNYRARVVNKLLEWIHHYTTNPEPNEWNPEMRREMMKTRNLQKKPEFKQDYEADKKVAETVPEWDRTVWFPMKKRLDEDGEEENVFVMRPEDKGIFFEVCRLADQLRVDKLCNHIQKLYTLAFVRGRIPDEIDKEDEFYPADAPYWEVVYPEFKQEDPPKEAEKAPDTKEAIGSVVKAPSTTDQSDVSMSAPDENNDEEEEIVPDQ